MVPTDWSNRILCSLVQKEGEAVDLIENSDVVTLCPDWCMGRVCTDHIRLAACLGDWRGRERTLKSVSDSQLLSLGATLAQAGPAHAILASCSLVADTLSGMYHSWLGQRVQSATQGHQPDVCGSLGSAVMWMSVLVVCVYKYKILFLLSVLDYRRVLKSVFFHVTL